MTKNQDTPIKIYSSGTKLTESRKCQITNNWCANEQWPKDQPCKCSQCQAWLCETIDHLERLAQETIKVYQSHTRTKCLILEVVRQVENDSNPGDRFIDSPAFAKLRGALSA